LRDVLTKAGNALAEQGKIDESESGIDATLGLAKAGSKEIGKSQGG